MAARPSLLEPIVKLEITVPSKYNRGDSGRLPRSAPTSRTRIAVGDMTVIFARAPLAEVARYAAQLGGMTQGQVPTRWN